MLIRPAMVAVTMTTVLLRKRDSPKVSMGRTMTCWLLRTATSEYRVPLTVRLLVAFNPLRWRRCTPKKKSECTRSLIPGSERTVGNTSNSAVLLEVRLISCDVLGNQATCDEQVQTPHHVLTPL